MPIESKKQSPAKAAWMKDNSKIYGVRVMKSTEKDMWDYLLAQKAKGIEIASIFKAAMREYMENHKED